MTTFIKMKLKISDDQTNIDKYRLINTCNKFEIYFVIKAIQKQKLIKIQIILQKFIQILHKL